jgi:hypothetical protein
MPGKYEELAQLMIRGLNSTDQFFLNALISASCIAYNEGSKVQMRRPVRCGIPFSWRNLRLYNV